MKKLKDGKKVKDVEIRKRYLSAFCLPKLNRFAFRMSQLALTLHGLVSEERGDSFYGLFVYDGDHKQPPANRDPSFKLMQLQDYWIAFSDDREISDCSKCSSQTPFVECTDDVRFCHLRFPLNSQGTAHAVQTLTDIAPAPSTAFIVAYSAQDLANGGVGGGGGGEGTEGGQGGGGGGGMNARSIMRFPLKNKLQSKSNARRGDERRNQEQKQSEMLAKDEALADENKCSIRKWTVVGIIVLGIIATIVGVTLIATRKQNLAKSNGGGKGGGGNSLAENAQKSKQKTISTSGAKK